MPERIFPFRGHPNELLVHKNRSIQIAIEHLHAGDVDALHPFQVGGDTFFRHVAIQPMPPDARLGGIRRIAKAVFECTGGILGERESMQGSN